MTGEARRPAIVLASASPARGQVLHQAGVVFEAEPARVDEDEIKAAMLADGAVPREIAQALAELKAIRVAGRRSGLVIGADQVLDFNGALLSKPSSVDAAAAQLRELRGVQHRLISAVAVAREVEIDEIGAALRQIREVASIR